MMDEMKNFDELLRILKAHDQCEKQREKDYASKDNQQGQYNSYTRKNYHQGNLEDNNHNYLQRMYQDNQPNHHNGNQRFQNNGRGEITGMRHKRGQVRGEGIENEWNNGSTERRVNVNHIVQQLREQEDRIERVEHRKKETSREMLIVPEMTVEVIISMNILSQYGLIINLDKRCIKWKNEVKYFVKEDTKVIQKVTALDKEMSINNVNIEEVDENVKLGEENKISEEIHDE
ncbi:hypothetical protein FQA39_LY02992 [Lamprigera yunnana]|nr:hypothetical protein FQA39_LY02992 [Lamprigera yunnana]